MSAGIRSVNSQRTPYTSPSCVSYKMYFVSILGEKITVLERGSTVPFLHMHTIMMKASKFIMKWFCSYYILFIMDMNSFLCKGVAIIVVGRAAKQMKFTLFGPKRICFPTEY